MTEAELIRLEAMLQADHRNGDIVARILMADSAKCTCCNFKPNAHAFDQLLAAYIAARINETKWKNRYLGYRHDATYFAYSAGGLEKSYDRSVCHAIDLKSQLDAMQPCFRCRLKYNPTNKHKFLGQVLRERPSSKMGFLASNPSKPIAI